MADQSFNTVSTDWQAEQRRLQQQQRLAEALTAQGQQSLQGGMVGNIYVQPSFTQGLAKLANALSGRLVSERASEKEKDLATRRSEAIARALGDIPQAQTTSTTGAGMTGGLDSQDYQPGAAPGDTQTTQPTMQQNAAWLGQLSGLGPDAVSMGSALMSMQNKRGPIKLGAGETLVSPDTYKPVYTAPPKQEAFTLAPGATRYGADNKPIASAPEKEDEFTRNMRLAGIDPASPEGLRLIQARLQKSVTHPAAPNVKVDVKTGESLGKEIGPMVSESRAGALGALQTAEVAQRVKRAIESGNVNIGPTATIRNSIDQLSQTLGIGGESTEERLVNTRNVIRGLAQATVAARKQLKGQGQVSDFEGKLLQKAESGEIDNMTVPELKSFMELSERLGKLQYDLHTHNVDVMRQRQDLQNLVPFYEVPQWGAFNENAGGPPPGAVRRKR